jgi:hypothetical protein
MNKTRAEREREREIQRYGDQDNKISDKKEG